MNHLPAETRLWIYQSNRTLNEKEVQLIENQSLAFVQQWTSHNRDLRAHAEIRHNLFLILMVDETNADASGCSIDKSVHFMQTLGAAHGIDWFDRMTFAYLDGDSLKTAPRPAFAALYQEGKINNETLVFNNLIQHLGDLSTKWVVPLKDSWHKRMV
jgi:hypothetical protein